MINAGTTKHVYNGNGVTRDWDYTFFIATTDGSDIKLYKTSIAGVITEITSHYFVDVVNKHVTYPTVVSGLPLLATGEKITLIRIEPLSQASDWKNQGPFNAETVEAALDKVTMITQQQNEQLSRAVKYGIDQTPTADDTDTFLSAITAAKNDAIAAKIAAQAAQTAAETAETNAETAQTAAETAETNAETAQTAAETAKTAAQAAQTAAETAETNAETAQTAAETAETNAETAQTAAETARDQAAAYAASAAGIPIATAGGTVNAITADYTPDMTLSNLVICAFVATGANTSTTPTFSPDGLTPRTITKKGGQALIAGDIPGAEAVCIVEYNLANTRWELLNPATDDNFSGIDANKPASPTLNQLYYATDTFKLYFAKTAGTWTDITAEFAGFVRLTGDQTIAGIKEFSSLKLSGNANCNQKQLVSAVIENRTTDPSSPVIGQIWLRTDV